MSDQTPQLFELGPAVERIIVSPVHHVGIIVVVQRLPAVVEDHAKQRHPPLINQLIEDRPQFVVVETPIIGVHAEPINELVRHPAINRDGRRRGRSAQGDQQCPDGWLQTQHMFKGSDDSALLISALLISLRGERV